uniref:Uncharacterized protein n=1 Tax=Arundo donax TaxID=35708 RepID=A0A0A9CT64_ARUDO
MSVTSTRSSLAQSIIDTNILNHCHVDNARSPSLSQARSPRRRRAPHIVLVTGSTPLACWKQMEIVTGRK